MKIIFSKRFLWTFSASFSIYLLIIVLHYFSRYAPDVLQKDFPASLILKFTLYTALTQIGSSLVFGYFCATVLSFKHFTNTYKINIKQEIISGVFISLLFALVLFGYNNWILPKVNHEARTLIFSMQIAAPGEGIQDDYKDLFQDDVSTFTMFRISDEINKTNSEIIKYKSQCKSSLSKLPQKLAEYNYNELNLKKDGIQFPSNNDTRLSENKILVIERDLRISSMSLNMCSTKRKELIKEQCSRTTLIFELILFFIIGALLGFYFKDQKSFLLILAVYFSLSILLGIKLIFENFILLDIFGYVSSVIISQSIFIAFVVSFFLITHYRDKKTTVANNTYM